MPAQDPRRPALPGTAHAARDRLRPGSARRKPTSLRQAMGSKRSQARMAAMRERLMAGMAERGITGDRRRRDRPEARSLRRLRVPGEPLGELRLPGVRERLAEAALPGVVRRRAAERPAHGLLLAPHPRARRHPPRRPGARPLRPRLASRLHARAPHRRRGTGGFPRPGWHADVSTHAIRLGLRYVRGLSERLLDRIDDEREPSSPSSTSRTSPAAAAPPSTRSSPWPPRARSPVFGVERREGLWAAGALRDARPDDPARPRGRGGRPTPRPG